MKRTTLFIFLFFSCVVMMRGQSNTTDKPCAPMKDGKVCYRYDLKANQMSKAKLYDIINKWAAKAYGSDVFFSNVSSNRSRGTVLVSSKVELLLDDTDKTFIKFKMRAQCEDNLCSLEISDIVYQYDPNDEKRFKVYPAEDVIAGNGKDNKVKIIQDPLLFCNATLFFAEGLMKDVVNAIKAGR